MFTPITTRPINYVRHLNAFFKRAEADARLAPPHVSLYIELFYRWNTNRFQNPIRPPSSLDITVSKIRSKTTYRKILNELHAYGYINYQRPIKNAPANVTMLLLDGQDLINNRIANGAPPASDCSTDHQQMAGTPIVIKSISNLKAGDACTPSPPTVVNEEKILSVQPIPHALAEARDFFKANGSTTIEADIFFHHYSSVGWRIGATRITDWHAAARKWMARPAFTPKSQTSKNTHVTTDKDYSKPF